jgi:hypothetical protein
MVAAAMASLGWLSSIGAGKWASLGGATAAAGAAFLAASFAFRCPELNDLLRRRGPAPQQKV